MKIRVTRKQTGEKFNTEENATRTGFNRLFNDYQPFTKGNWDDATENGHVAFSADEEDFEILNQALTLNQVVAQAAQAHSQKNNAATAAQINYLDILSVRIESGMTKSRASQLITAAKNGDLGNAGGFYTDGSS